MSVGIAALDADHREFVRLINLLQANVKYAERRDLARRALSTLEDYARFHFAREEAVMRVCGFPGLDAHRDEHRRFVAWFRDAALRLEGDPEAAVGDELLDFLVQWLNHHILIQDMAYRPYTDGKAEALAAAESFPPPAADAR